MSVVQFGENTVSIVLINNRYSIRELEVDKDIINNTVFDENRLVNAWKNQCLTRKNLIANPSSLDEEMFVDNLNIEGSRIEIHFRLHQTSTGIFKDKRAVAFAVLQKS